MESDEEIDTIQEHSELVILFSYMTIFACFFPGACLLFLVNNHYEMIKDLRTFEKSKLVLPKKSGGIGLWKDIYRYTLYLSIISNSYFLLFFSNSFPKFGGFPKIVLIIAFEHFIIFQSDFDVFNALDLMDNPEFLEKLKFGIGDGNLQYYLYNWRCPPMKNENVGLVLQ